MINKGGYLGGILVNNPISHTLPIPPRSKIVFTKDPVASVITPKNTPDSCYADHNVSDDHKRLVGQRCRVRDRGHPAGRKCFVLAVVRLEFGQDWAMIEWDDEYDPACFKASALVPLDDSEEKG